MMAESTGLYHFIDCPSVSYNELNQEDESAENIGDPLSCQKSRVQNVAGFQVKEECEKYFKSEEENDPSVKKFLESKEGVTVLSLFREFLEYIGLKLTINAYESEVEVGKYYNYFGRTKLAHDLKLNPDAEGPLIAQVLPHSEVCPSLDEPAVSETISSSLSTGKIDTDNVFKNLVLKTEDTDELCVQESKCHFDFVKVEQLTEDSDPLSSQSLFPCISDSYMQPKKRSKRGNNRECHNSAGVLDSASLASTSFLSHQSALTDEKIQQDNDAVHFSFDAPEVVNDDVLEIIDQSVDAESTKSRTEIDTERNEESDVDDVVWIEDESLPEPEAGSKRTKSAGRRRLKKIDQENHNNDKLKRKRELNRACVEKYRKRKQTEFQRLKSLRAQENHPNDKLERKRELNRACVQKYRKKKRTELQLLKSFKQDDHTAEAQEKNAEWKKEKAKERSRRYRDKKRLSLLKSVHHMVYDPQIPGPLHENQTLVLGDQENTIIHDSQITGTPTIDISHLIFNDPGIRIGENLSSPLNEQNQPIDIDEYLAERKKASAKERSRRYREKKRLSLLKSVHHVVHDPKNPVPLHGNPSLVLGDQQNTIIYGSQIPGTSKNIDIPHFIFNNPGICIGENLSSLALNEQSQPIDIEENLAERKKASAKERSRRYREKKRLFLLKYGHHIVHDSQIQKKLSTKERSRRYREKKRLFLLKYAHHMVHDSQIPESSQGNPSLKLRNKSTNDDS